MRKLFAIYTAVIAMLLVQGFSWAGVRDLQTADVTVYKEAAGGQYIYNYAVTNKGNRPIIGLTVGHDFYRGHTELAGSHPRQVLSPNMWSSRVVTLEESDQYEVSWDIEAPSAAIQPGQTVQGFRIIATQDSPLFTTSNWTVIVDGPPVNASNPLELTQGPAPNVDLVPPQLSVNLMPNVIWPPNRKMINIAATITISDNTDPNPKIKLLSIVCNECPKPEEDISGAAFGTDDRSFAVRADRIGRGKAGRTYTVTYSASDAAGNTSTAQTVVSIPHDQRK